MVCFFFFKQKTAYEMRISDWSSDVCALPVFLYGLAKIEAEYEAGGLVENLALEDIHMHVESRLAELIGPAAGRLHTARSRNDQVATDFRLWVRDSIDAITGGLEAYAQALLRRAEEHADTVIPGFSHPTLTQTG